MGRTHLHELTVEFGDCDPAQIAYLPNFFRWFDVAAHRFFQAGGLPPWRELEAQSGLVGTPVVSTQCQFLRPTTYGDRLTVHTAVAEWRDKSFVLRHVLQRGAEVIAECHETRVFARRDPADSARLQAVPPPPELRRLLE